MYHDHVFFLPKLNAILLSCSNPFFLTFSCPLPISIATEEGNTNPNNMLTLDGEVIKFEDYKDKTKTDTITNIEPTEPKYNNPFET